MGNISDEINIIDAEIEKTKKTLLKELEGYKELERKASDHFKRYQDIPPKAENFAETRKILVDAMRDASKGMKAHKHGIEDLQARLNTLEQSRENKLNKIVFREDLEEVDKLQKEAEELRQRKSELSIKYAKPKTQDTPAMFDWLTDDKQEVYCNGKLIVELSNKPFKLFCCLYKKRGKFVYNKTLMNAGSYPQKEYDKSFVDMMNKLENTLKKGLDKQGLAIKGKVLEKKRDNERRNIAYKLIT